MRKFILNWQREQNDSRAFYQTRANHLWSHVFLQTKIQEQFCTINYFPNYGFHIGCHQINMSITMNRFALLFKFRLPHGLWSHTYESLQNSCKKKPLSSCKKPPGNKSDPDENHISFGWTNWQNNWLTLKECIHAIRKKYHLINWKTHVGYHSFIHWIILSNPMMWSCMNYV